MRKDIVTMWTMLSASTRFVASVGARTASRPAFASPSALRRSSGTRRAAAAFGAAGDRTPSASHTHHHRTAHNNWLSSTVRLSSTKIDATESDKVQPVPVTLLAGFLGSGKTSALKNLLENSDGVRVGVIVNDVAAVNIDAKLISKPSNDGSTTSSDSSSLAGDIVAEYGGTIELQNGCACCSLADELLTSVESLMAGRNLDAIVVELSGVADPVAVKQNWEQAKAMQHPATKLADVNRVVTVIDSCTFGTDWMTWDSAGERDNWTEDGDDCAGDRKVPELLAEQVEAADLLLVNKIDLAGPEQVKVATSVARGLNDEAELFEVEFGKVAVQQILGGGGKKAREAEKEEEASSGHDHSHAHDDDDACAEPDCTDPSHEHSHSHEHDSAAEACAEPDCTDTSHSHSHDHDAAEAACTEPDCTDTSHSHSHDHGSGSDTSSTSTDKLGISNFVYKASVPFNSNRLLGLLNNWPVPIKEDLDIGQLQKATKDGLKMDGKTVEKSPFIGVLRSKGFCWMAPSKWSGTGDDAWRHDTAMFWSHAGKHFGITTAGKWWGSISKEQMKGYFGANMKEYERILAEDWASEEWGDRRQELVFIGTGLDETDITDALDECLLTDEEMEAYEQQLRNFIETTFTSEAVGGSGPSLFDTGGTDHMDVNK